MNDLFDRIGSATCFCGLCCHGLMCERCMRNTLKANGFRITQKNMDKLRAVKDAGHGRYFGANEYTWVIGRMCYDRKHKRKVG